MTSQLQKLFKTAKTTRSNVAKEQFGGVSVTIDLSKSWVSMKVTSNGNTVCRNYTDAQELYEQMVKDYPELVKMTLDNQKAA